MKLCIIGGGAAGMAAAVFAAERGASVHVFEKNEKLGRKLFITGKGRCNFTNACPEEDLFPNVVTNPRFMYSSFGRWNSDDTINFFEKLGVKTKVERGNRAFPASDHSSDIIRALEKRMKALGVKIHLGSEVEEILYAENGEKEAGIRTEMRACGLRLRNGADIACDAVLIATGGISYQSTGSTGDGYRFAQKTGHRVIPAVPALVPLVTKEDYITEMQGLSLRNVTLTIGMGKKKKFSMFGEMLFTHFGISGPLALTASSYIGKALEKEPLRAEIDLKPALSDAQLDARILREFDGAKNRSFHNAVAPLFPAKMRPVMVRLSGVPEDKPVNAVTKEEREHFRHLIKAFPFTITGKRDFNEAIITQGGVSVKDINPSTMESKLVKNLYFAGEVIDVDCLTGGFNLQTAWATAHTAAESITAQEDE